MMDITLTSPRRVDATITLPASKSITARALLVGALAEQPGQLASLAVCDDTHALLQGLAATHGTIDVGPAGTAMRLLVAYHACQPGHQVVIDGDLRMRQRPMAPLIDALQTMGAHIRCLDRDGFAPLAIEGRQMRGPFAVRLPAGISSQFATALLLIAPVVGGIRIELEGDIVSAPYIDMTLAVMRHYGVEAHWQGHCIEVPAARYSDAPLTVEADWSAASYWLALQALLPESRIALRGLLRDSWQGDSRMLALMQQMGMGARWMPGGDLALDMVRAGCCCCSTYADLNGTPDLAPTLIVALCLLGRPFRLTGLHTLRHKESDRREALRTELMKLGYVLQLEGDDAVQWHFESCPTQPHPRIHPHGDHRIAMAMALAATRHPGITIADADVVGKSYPNYWKHLQAAGFACTATFE